MAAPIGHNAPAGLRWSTDLTQASRLAREQRKPLLIDFYADWCGPCRKMAQSTFGDPDVARVLGQMVCVRIDIDRQRLLALRYHVDSIPRVMVKNSEGETVLDLVGYVDAQGLLELLSSIASQVGGLKMPGSEAGTVPAGTIAAWVEGLGSAQEGVRNRSRRRLRSAGAAAIPHLAAALTHRYLAVRVAAYDLLLDLAPSSGKLPYDPWGDKATRSRQAKTVQAWVRKLGAKSEQYPGPATD